MDFGRSLENLEQFKFEDADVFFKANGRRERNIDKGYKFFYDGFIHDMWTNNTVIKAKCYRSQRKNEKPHELFLSYLNAQDKSVKISDAYCTCAAGKSKSCNHLTALAYALQHLVLQRFRQIPQDVSCTSLPQSWNKPRGTQILSDTVMNITFTSPSIEEKKKAPILCSLYNPKKGNDSSGNRLTEAKSKLQTLNKSIAMSYLIDTRPCSGITLSLGFKVPENSVLAHQQLQNFHKPENISDNVPNQNFRQFPIITPETQNIFFSVPPVTFKYSLQLNLEECFNLEKNTKNQNKSDIWRMERKKRFTASHFGELCKRKVVFNEKFLTRIFCPPDISNVPQVAHGIKNEQVAIDKYLQANDFNVKVYKCGLVVNPLSCHLGASPDGQVLDKDENGLLEIKCSFHPSLRAATKVKTFYIYIINETPVVNKSHNYYYQVQGQMLICGAPWCDFVVYFSKSDELFIQRLYFDSSFCIEMFYKLQNNYINFAVPFLEKEFMSEMEMEEKENVSNISS